jgi:nucleoid-associated protein YgaU
MPNPATRSVASVLLPILLAIPLAGCVGGGAKRNASGDTVSKNHWVFPLYHYGNDQGRKTLRPFFLIPIHYGTAEGGEVASGDGLDYASGDSPAWNSAPSGSEYARGGPRATEAVEPGVWGSSLPQDAAAAGAATEHEVRAGETLYAISKRYYGSGSQWTRIADANRDRVASPQALTIGTKLRIP